MRNFSRQQTNSNREKFLVAQKLNNHLLVPIGQGLVRCSVVSKKASGQDFDQVFWHGQYTITGIVTSNCVNLVGSPATTFQVFQDSRFGGLGSGSTTSGTITQTGFYRFTGAEDFWVNGSLLLPPFRGLAVVPGAVRVPNIADATAYFAQLYGLSADWDNLARVSTWLDGKGYTYSGSIPSSDFHKYFREVAWEHSLVYGGDLNFHIRDSASGLNLIHSDSHVALEIKTEHNEKRSFEFDCQCLNTNQVGNIKITSTKNLTQVVASSQLEPDIYWSVKVQGVKESNVDGGSYGLYLRELLLPGEFAGRYRGGMELILDHSAFVNGSVVGREPIGVSVGDVAVVNGQDFSVVSVNPTTLNQTVSGTGRILDNTPLAGLALVGGGSFSIVGGRLTLGVLATEFALVVRVRNCSRVSSVAREGGSQAFDEVYHELRD